MTTLHRRRRAAVPIVVALTLVLALLPASWLGWTADLADLVRIPVMPLAHVGTRLSGWVRPPMEPGDLPGEETERSAVAIAERDEYRQLYNQQRLRADELADQLRTLQGLPPTALRNPMPPLVLPMDITGINPSDPSSHVELKLMREARGRVVEGDLAVVGHDIVGRIARIGAIRVELRPIPNSETGLVRGAVMAAFPGANREPIPVLLKGDGRGALHGEVDARSGVVVGDLVVLDEPSWPAVGRGLVLGRVMAAAPMDEAPLRRALRVVPQRRARDQAWVIVLATGEGEQ